MTVEQNDGEFDIRPEDELEEGMEVQTADPEVNPYFEHFDTPGLRDISGREVKVEDQKFPGAVVTAAGPLEEGGPSRYFVKWGWKDFKKSAGKGRYKHEECFTVGQKITDLLPDYLAEQFQDTCERVEPYLKTGLALASERASDFHVAELIRQAVGEFAPTKELRQDPKDFETCMRLRHADTAMLDASWKQAKLQYTKEFTDAAFNLVVCNIQMWLGCMLPIGVAHHPRTEEGGDMKLDIDIEIFPLPQTKDGQEEQAWYCTPDVMLHDTNAWLVMFPEDATESFYRKVGRNVLGPSVDRKAPLQFEGSAKAPAGMEETPGGLIIPS